MYKGEPMTPNMGRRQSGQGIPANKKKPNRMHILRKPQFFIFDPIPLLVYDIYCYITPGSVTIEVPTIGIVVEGLGDQGSLLNGAAMSC